MTKLRKEEKEPGTIRTYLNSVKGSLVKDPRKKSIPDSHIKGFKLSKLKFCLARDYILTSLMFDNASRPGATSNMILEEFEKAIFRENGYVISV